MIFRPQAAMACRCGNGTADFKPHGHSRKGEGSDDSLENIAAVFVVPLLLGADVGG
jgi:hypothetical protein